MILLIPGPVTTAKSVKNTVAMDISPWHKPFQKIFASTKKRIVKMVNGSPDLYQAAIIAASGHVVMESIIRSYVCPKNKILIPQTGWYAERLTKISQGCNIAAINSRIDGNQVIDFEDLENKIQSDDNISHIGLVYSETSSGIIADINRVVDLCNKYGLRLLVDAVSAFGALPLNLEEMKCIDAVGATSGKCLEALPGCGIIVYRKDRLQLNFSSSYTLDIADMLEHDKRHGQGFARFTPATNVVVSMHLALDLLDAEGGPIQRLTRYKNNMSIIYDGLTNIGLQPVLPLNLQGPIIGNFHINATDFNIGQFSDYLYDNKIIISPWMPLTTPSIRVGAIGALNQAEMHHSVNVINSYFS